MDEWNVPQTVMRQSQFTWLLPGEDVEIQDSNISFVSVLGTIRGDAYLTKYRLRFEGKDDKGFHFDIPLGCIAKVEKIGRSKMSMPGNAEYGLLISCKDMRDVRFASQASTHSRRPLYDNLLKFAFPLGKSTNLPFFASIYHQKYDLRSDLDGWKLFDTKREFARMKVPNQQWVLTDLNNGYQFSDTYPRVMAIPSAAEKQGKEFVIRVGEFRSRQRIPILSWHHPSSQAVITRSSQPLSGVTNRKNLDDENYLQMIVAANAESHQLFIFDARPIVNAKLNRAKGGGYEEGYEQCHLQFLNIHNIHVVRESLRKVRDSLFPRVDERNYLKLIEESKWLHHLSSILQGANAITREVELKKTSVLVHCSDGWDRTAQLTSLAMIQLDPFYRTIQGFGTLIEKEWCSFGHKFAHRIGHGEDKAGDAERSPVFVQFIDCVYQLLIQYGACFEFTTELLICILDELYSCRFGTFLYNNEKQRISEKKCNRETVSLWTYVIKNRTSFLNPLFNDDDSERKIIFVNPSVMQLKIFKEYYARYNPHVIAPGSQIIKKFKLERAIGQATLLEQIVKQDL